MIYKISELIYKCWLVADLILQSPFDLRRYGEQDEFWIGLTDIEREGQFRWVNGEVSSERLNEKQYLINWKHMLILQCSSLSGPRASSLV